jgi:phospholipid/cholesterol/gamma-HCH transport system substrate-binding protein
VERDARYTAVGLFALLAIAAAVAFVWWYSGASDRRDYTRYEIHFTGTVSGLSQGSPVRYLGVDVGRVDSLHVDSGNAGQVNVIADIDSSAPISGATRAKLGLLGLTGLLYIDLQQDLAADARQPLAQGKRYPVIPAQKGSIEEFLETLPDAVTRAANVMMRIEKVLSDENIESLSATLANVQVASDELPDIARQANQLTAEMRTTSTELSALATTLREVTNATRPDLQTTLAEIRRTADNLSRASASLDRIVSGNEAALSQFAGSGVGDVHQLVLDVRDASNEVRALAQSLRENPSSLLRRQRRGGVELPE